jgi:type I site-specific restriction endonuclease
MSTGVDAQTCKLIVLDQRIKSMTEFKQIIGRGTRINEDYDKFYFTIMDFKHGRPSCSPIPTSTAIRFRSTSPVEKYADSRIHSLENLETLKVDPFTEFGTPIEIIKMFGGRDQYLQAVHDLENQLYEKAS